MRTTTIAATVILATCLATGGGTEMSIPADFPRFTVPGHENDMQTLRELFWLHYPGAGPKATLWDEWLSMPAMWPAVETDGTADRFRQQWADVLSSRMIDPEGYVATHQHASIAHQHGWPFPFWNQGQGGYGWHFSFENTVGSGWRQTHLNTTEGWLVDGAEDKGIGESGWELELVSAGASLSTPVQAVDTFQSPFIQLRWKASGLGAARPCLEWATKETPEFDPERRFYFEAIDSDSVVYTMIPVYKHPKWTGEITCLKLSFGNAGPGAKVTIQALFTQYDTRHNINSQNFIRGCAEHFLWTGNLDFLRSNINRMRLALRYLMTEHEALKRKVVYTPWVGHDGRTGLKLDPDGKKTILSGHGIGNNYWDLLPFGNLDCYATIHYYDALLDIAQIEREIAAHPEWNMPLGVFAFDPRELEHHAADVKVEGNKLFWNEKTGRFFACIDADGQGHDYGFTFLNLEAIYYDFATPEHAKSIMSWICGDRTVEGDTATADEIYHWRFAPRATTKRNVEWYLWVWSAPESIPWGGQIQDGGAVLGFSYHDLMARLASRGPDDAWQRLQGILEWFREVQAAGGYRKYYDGSREGTLQGGGTAGGLGMDSEFFESALVPQVVVTGFLGFAPTADGFKIDPNLPSDWPELTVDRIRVRELVLSVKATPDAIEVTRTGEAQDPWFVHLPAGKWRVEYLGQDGSAAPVATSTKRDADGATEIDWTRSAKVRFRRQ